MSSSLLACTMQAAYLAEQHSDRATRVAAYEFLHAVTLWIVGEPYAALHSASSAYIQHLNKQLGMVLALPPCELFAVCVPLAGSWHRSGTCFASTPSAACLWCLIRHCCLGAGLRSRALHCGICA